jgi:hypothetical protein
MLLVDSEAEEVLRMLKALPPVRERPVELPAEYLQHLEWYEALPDHAPGTDKSWVRRCDEAFRRSMSRAVRIR